MPGSLDPVVGRLATTNKNMEQTETEIWVCGHTKKCGWSGPQSELKYIEVEIAPLRVSKGSCPKCGQVKTGFYVRKVKPSNEKAQ